MQHDAINLNRLKMSLLGFGAIAWSLLAFATGGASASESLVNRLPSGVLATVEIAKLGPVISTIENSKELKQYLDSPLYDDVLKNDGVRKALAGKALAETQLGMSLWQAAKTYLGDRVLLGVYAP